MTDNDGDQATASLHLRVGDLAELEDSIFAIPNKTSVQAGQAVRITVFTYKAANPFHFMNNVTVTFPTASGVAYVGSSFDTGAPDDTGDRALPIDGVWAVMAPSGFLLGPDHSITVLDLSDGRQAINFNVTPLGGMNLLEATGAMFNFEVTFANPGVAQVSFQRQSPDLILRTYYQDGSQSTAFPWSSDDNAGWPTITVY